ncbi:MAG TPA: fluoride efflux transporter CrcB [Chryseosolibacter sp.]|nr:fluoride efflux transporter CrcB [Chryseosolibacter sp.]
MNFYTLLIVGTGGFIGTVGRFLTGRLVENAMGSSFPWGTMVVNVFGSFIIGVVYGLTLREDLLNRNWRFFLATGVCGGYTTFSAFAVENLSMINQKMVGSSILYVFATIILGLLAVFSGAMIGKALSSQA